jgi:hypothetical protein
MRRHLAALSLLLVAGCGLPMAGGVQEPGALPSQQSQGGGDIQVLPPGPRDDASAFEIVRNFFGAQSDPADGHASARQFLAPELQRTWRDTGVVSVFGTELEVDPLAADRFRVTGALVGRIGTDGAYGPADGTIDVQVQLRRGPRGRWLISKVPDGLLLSAADRDRSFRARSVYFLAPPASPSVPSSHVVPDPIFLPVAADPADALVRRLLAGPSRPLGDSVRTAFPPGTTIRRVIADPAGIVTVDLSAQVGSAPQLQKEQMSAQLGWTLLGGSDTTYSSVRLESVGRPVAIRGPGGQADDTQDRTDSASYDPDGLSARATLYYIGGRRLRQLDPTAGPVSDASGQVVVDQAAASPRGGSLALLSHGRRGDVLQTGPASGPFPVRAQARSLASPTWGSGEAGVFYLDDGAVELAPLAGAPVQVPVDGIAPYGPMRSIRVSRDGARAAIVAGTGASRCLLVGRLATRGGTLHILDLRDVAPAVTDVRDLAWDSATSVIVLGRMAGVSAPIRVVIDGSSVALVPRVFLTQGTPLSVAAAPKRPLAIGASLDGQPVLLRDNGSGAYSQESGIVGGLPFYPG